jgi:basic membrane lipoprotein Med (substrate-binding protein (PBP1-ABC) superfamily)
VLLFEEPHWETLGNGTLLTARLAAGAIARGYIPSIRVVGSALNPMDQLVRAAGALRSGTLVVGPLLSYEWESFAARFPNLRFILIGDIPPGEVPSNVLVLTFDRTAAFRSAGRLASQAVRSSGGHIGVLTSTVSDLDEAETAAFLEGASVAADPPAPDVRSLPASPDRAAVQSAIGDLRRGGAAVILLGLGSLDAWALEVMNGLGGRAVLADWKASGSYPRVVFLSVEEDIPGGITRAYRALSRGEKVAAGEVVLATGGAPG